MYNALFSNDIIEKHVFEKKVLVGIGRDLKLPQAVAQEQCRKNSKKLHQMWSDGFTISYTLECLTDWILEDAKTDDDLYWYLHKRCRETQELFDVEHS